MKRVVVTGLGIICAAGEDKNEFYRNMVNGKPCVEQVENFDVSLFNSKIASQDLHFHSALAFRTTLSFLHFGHSYLVHFDLSAAFTSFRSFAPYF